MPDVVIQGDDHHYAGRVSVGEGVDKTRAVCGLGPAGGLHGTRQLDGQLVEV